VVCHGGQGLATEVEAAHGHVEHWETPLLTGTLLQASCAKCHDNLADLKIKNNVYAADILRAKKLFKESGCIGCHQVHGEGGPISVDLAEETAIRPLSRIDFGYTGFTQDEKTLANWIRIHLARDPVTFVPGDPEGKFNTEPIAPSAMPPYLFAEKDVEALTAYILGMNHQNLPNTYLVTRPAEKEPTFSNAVQHGAHVYEKYGCNACHGYDARGGVRNFNYQYGVTPNLRRVVGTYSREELKDKISNGVPIVAKHNPDGPLPPLYMPAWKTKIKGVELEDLVTYLQSIKE
jgi:cytochrome c2